MQKKKKLFAECQWLALGETGFAESRLQKLGEVKSLPSASLAPLGKANVRQPVVRKAHNGRTCWARAPPLPSAGPVALVKDNK